MHECEVAQGDLEDLRREIESLREEINDLRTEKDQDVDQLRREMEGVDF